MWHEVTVPRSKRFGGVRIDSRASGAAEPGPAASPVAPAEAGEERERGWRGGENGAGLVSAGSAVEGILWRERWL